MRVKNAFERTQVFEQVTKALLQGDGCAVSFSSEDSKALGVKWPQRVALDSLKRWLRENLPEAGFTVRKYRSNGAWVVSVTPPLQKKRKREAGGGLRRTGNYGAVADGVQIA